MKMKITEIDALTNEKIEREATADELEQFQSDMNQVSTKETAAAEAKAAILAKLGLTAEELAAALA